MSKQIYRHYDITDSPTQAERNIEDMRALWEANEDYKAWEPYLIGAATAALCLVAWFAVPVLWRAL